MVQQAIQDGIGDGGFTDDGMPVFDRALAGDDSGIFLIAVLDDFEQIVTLRVIEWSQKQIIEDKQWTLAKRVSILRWEPSALDWSSISNKRGARR